MSLGRIGISRAGAGGDLTVDSAAWLAEGVLLVALSGPALDDASGEIEVATDDPQGYGSGLVLHEDRKKDRRLGIFVARLPENEDDDVLPELRIRLPRREHAVGPRALAPALTELRALVRECLAGLDAETRNGISDFLASALSRALAEPGGEQIAEELLLVRESLRERLPYRITSRRESLSLAVDNLLAVDEHSFWVSGWAWNRHAALQERSPARMDVTLVSPEGIRVDVLAHAFRWVRRDIEELYPGLGVERPFESGYMSYLRLAAPSRLSSGWVAELETHGDGSCEVKAPEVVRGLEDVRDSILDSVGSVPKYSDRLMLEHVHPAISRLQDQLRDTVEAKTMLQWGDPPRSPRVSIIVPLYKRVDFIEHQLAQFVHDPGMRQADLIYVLDSPEREDALLRMAAGLYDMYRMPFRLIVLNRNAGFSHANNAGALVARAPLLLLLNSDVIPDQAGWLDVMADFYDATPGIGALGPKLLFEDESLQHAGMYFRDISTTPEGVDFLKDGRRSAWENVHYYKGLPRDLEAANVARQVPAVTGACLMVARDLYEEVGGLSSEYVRGGYEDSDFCLRLIERGLGNWYLPDAELYHLEGQSFVWALRDVATKYNMTLQAHLWGDVIRSLDQSEPAPIGSAG